ncbi:hypothetical protein V1478_015035 [Vespula squamosa]|uniref:Uncharacterized protein n=1 Tax=Vespula squamosa TaxID=30214 RepID=A0ABD2A3Y6_VESSQ
MDINSEKGKRKIFIVLAQAETFSFLGALCTATILFFGSLSLRNPSTNCCTESTVISAPSSITT